MTYKKFKTSTYNAIFDSLSLRSTPLDNESVPCFDKMSHFSLIKEINDILPVLREVQSGTALSLAVVESVRATLLDILNNVDFKFSNIALDETCYAVLLTLARKYPAFANERDPLTDEPIVPENAIYTASGLRYNSNTFRFDSINNERVITRKNQDINELDSLNKYDRKHIKRLLENDLPIKWDKTIRIDSSRFAVPEYYYDDKPGLNSLKESNVINLDEIKQLSKHQKECLAHPLIGSFLIRGDINLLSAIKISKHTLRALRTQEVLTFIDKYSQSAISLINYQEQEIINLLNPQIRKAVDSGDFNYVKMLQLTADEYSIVSYKTVYEFLRQQGKTPLEILALTPNEFANVIIPAVRAGVERGDYHLQEALNFNKQQRDNECNRQVELDAQRKGCCYRGM